METILANSEGKVRRLVRNGRKVIVAPAVLIVPGVLNGSQGPLYYPASEVSKYPAAWDGIPIVVNHPTVNGKPVSARKADVLAKYGVGMIFDSSFDDRLRAELNFDEEDTRRVDPRVLNALEKGEKIELSTGLNLTVETVPGKFNGTDYDGMALNYQPDHLAVLPDSKGACCIDHGCGVLANTEQSFVQKFMDFWKGVIPGLTLNAQMSHSELRMQLNRLIEAKYRGMASSMGKGGMIDYEDYPYVIDVYDKYVIFRANQKTYKAGYSTDLRNARVELSGEPTEVVKVSSYKAVANDSELTEIWADKSESTVATDNAAITNEGTMNKQQKIDWLVANCACWKNAKAELEKMSDEVVNALKQEADDKARFEAVHNAAVQGFSDGFGNTHTYDPKTGVFATNADGMSKEDMARCKKMMADEKGKDKMDKTMAGNQTPVAKPVTEAEWMASAPPSIQNRLKYVEEAERNEKAVLVNRITEHLTDQTARNQQCQWLMQKDLAELRNLALIVPAKPVATTNSADDDELPGVPSYVGANVGGIAHNAAEDVFDPVMNIDWSAPAASE